jgi:hypothetical protein
VKSWLDAPAVELVAKKCCVCGHPLVEAESVLSGIGPTCAEKTMAFRPGLEPSVRAEANKLIYELAVFQVQAESIPRINRLRDLGFSDLADRIFDRIGARLRQRASIRIDRFEHDERWLRVVLPWMGSSMFEKVIADMRTIPGWHVQIVAGKKESCLPNRTPAIHAFYRVLSKHFAGEVAQSPKSLFVVPSAEDLETMLAKKAA